jgi:uncharacterized alkaline shock family protein YloU
MSKATSDRQMNPGERAMRSLTTELAPAGPRWPGRIRVSSRAVATVAGRVVAECYGVVGVAAKRSRFGSVELLSPGAYRRGVDVRFADDHISIDVYVVLEHGLRITEVAHNIMASVKFTVERVLGVRVVRVNVNVQALRVDGAL